jgi:hypothetical protein
MFNTETVYMLWDAEHNGDTVNYLRQEDISYIFDIDGTELRFLKENVVNLGGANPPANKQAGKHYISTDDSGYSNQGSSVPSSISHKSEFSNSQNSGATTGSEETQFGGRRNTKKLKARKNKKATKKAKSRSKSKSRSKAKSKSKK